MTPPTLAVESLKFLESTDLSDDIDVLSMGLFVESGVKLPPTQYDLLCSDGNKMETYRHKLQMDLLIDTLQPYLRSRSDGFVSGDMFVYYSLKQVKNQDFKGPDFFAVLGVPKGERLSWVCWEEGKSPDVVIELLSPSTARLDKTVKKDIYQDAMKVPEYYWYNPFNSEDFKGFQMQNGLYQELQPDAQGNLPCHGLGLQLVRWEGEYYEISATWLRWAYPDGTLIPNREERLMGAEAEASQAQAEASQAQAAASQAQAAASQAQEQIQQIVRNLKAAGMDAAQIAIVTGLSIEQIR